MWCYLTFTLASNSTGMRGTPGKKKRMGTTAVYCHRTAALTLDLLAVGCMYVCTNNSVLIILEKK